MPESGEWFSPRTRPEMLTSDDPPIRDDKHDHLEILAGPATVAGRAVAPFRRIAELVPTLGRRLVRVDDEPSRLQLAGMWATGSALVAATGLAVAAVLGGAPPALTQQFDRLSVLPGLDGSSAQDDPAPAADNATGPVKSRTSAAVSSAARSSSSYRGYSLVPGVPAGAELPQEIVAAAGLPPTSAGGAAANPAPQPGNPAPPAAPGGGSVTTPPAVPPATQDPAPPVQTTDPVPPPPTVDPTLPVQTTDPAAPTDTPPPPPPGDTTAPADPPADNPPADGGADNPVGDPIAPAPPAPEPPTTPATP